MAVWIFRIQKYRVYLWVYSYTAAAVAVVLILIVQSSSVYKYMHRLETDWKVQQQHPAPLFLVFSLFSLCPRPRWYLSASAHVTRHIAGVTTYDTTGSNVSARRRMIYPGRVQPRMEQTPHIFMYTYNIFIKISP